NFRFAAENVRSRELLVLGYPLIGCSRSWELVRQALPLAGMAGRNACPTIAVTRASASMSGEEENKRSSDNAKNAEEGVDAAVEGSGVGIGFGRHESEN